MHIDYPWEMEVSGLTFMWEASSKSPAQDSELEGLLSSWKADFLDLELEEGEISSVSKCPYASRWVAVIQIVWSNSCEGRKGNFCKCSRPCACCHEVYLVAASVRGLVKYRLNNDGKRAAMTSAYGSLVSCIMLPF